MATPYSTDLRLKVLGACDRGSQTTEVAKMFSVSKSWVRRVKQRRREHDEVEARPMGGSRGIKIDRARLRELVQAQPDATLDELCQRMQVECSPSGINKVLKTLNLTFKKRRFMRRSRIVRMSLSDGRNGAAGRANSMRGG